MAAEADAVSDFTWKMRALDDRVRAKEWRGEEFAVAHEKHDGHRHTIIKDAAGDVTLHGRDSLPSMSMCKRYPWLKDEAWYRAALDLPLRSVVDGELLHEGGRASDVPTGLKQRRGLSFVAFALPWLAGTRRHLYSVQSSMDVLKYLGFVTANYCIAEGEPTREALVALAQSRGIEGYVLKQADYHGWFKVKPIPTVDCVVVDIKEGKGKYRGLVGALTVAVVNRSRQLTEIAHVSGMTDAQRRAMGRGDIGRVIEVAYQYVGSNGRLRHPRFVRWRDDKIAEQCGHDQLLAVCRHKSLETDM